MSTTIDKRQAEILTHMLGAGDHIPRGRRGYRNYYCTSVGDETLCEMEKAGLVVAGRTINDGRDQYFYATLAGCKAIGLSKAAIKRAFED